MEQSAKVQRISNARQSSVVDLLRKALEDAESGKIIGVVIATVAPGRITSSSYATGHGVSLAELSGCVAQCQHRIQLDWWR